MAILVVLPLSAFTISATPRMQLMLWTERSWMGAIYALTLLGTIAPNRRVAATDRAHAHLGVTTRALVAAIVKDAARVRTVVTRVANVAPRAVTYVAALAMSANHGGFC